MAKFKRKSEKRLAERIANYNRMVNNSKMLEKGIEYTKPGSQKLK